MRAVQPERVEPRKQLELVFEQFLSPLSTVGLVDAIHSEHADEPLRVAISERYAQQHYPRRFRRRAERAPSAADA